MRRLDSKELLSCRAVVEDALYVVPGQKVNDEEPSWTAPALCPHAPGPRSESASDIVRPQREGSPGPFFAGGGAGVGVGVGFASGHVLRGASADYDRPRRAAS